MIVHAITFAIAAIAHIMISSIMNERHPFIFFPFSCKALLPYEDIFVKQTVDELAHQYIFVKRTI